jgi:hypothetical protein
MLYAEPAFAFSAADSSARADRPSAPTARDRDGRSERWPARLSWTDLVATTESEWHRRVAARAADSTSKATRSPEALFCRFEVDNVFDR